MPYARSLSRSAVKNMRTGATAVNPGKSHEDRPSWESFTPSRLGWQSSVGLGIRTTGCVHRCICTLRQVGTYIYYMRVQKKICIYIYMHATTHGEPIFSHDSTNKNSHSTSTLARLFLLLPLPLLLLLY